MLFPQGQAEVPRHRATTRRCVDLRRVLYPGAVREGDGLPGRCRNPREPGGRPQGPGDHRRSRGLPTTGRCDRRWGSRGD